MNDDHAALIEQLTKRFTDEGRLIEAGWQVMRTMVLPPTASDVQLTEMRKAYFTGAQHLFASLASAFSSDDDEPTPEDLQRMDLIHKELEGFVEELKREIGKPSPKADPRLPDLRGQNPRRAGGDIAGPGGPYDQDGVVVDTTNAVLLDFSTVTLVESQRADGGGREPAVALMLEGRVNKKTTRTKVLYMLNGDGAAAIVTELLGLAKRAESTAPQLATEMRAALGERWDEMPK